MAKNMQPIAKRCKALGISPAVMGYAKKETKRNPGGQMRKKKSEYAIQLNEKQKVKFVYGILEKQFRMYYEKASAMSGKTGENLLTLVERRLDNVIYRLGFAMTRREARQLVNHAHFTVNGKKVNIPSYLVRVGDVIEVKEIRMSPGIGENDFNTKLKNGQKFLQGGDRLKVTIRFRGREMAHTNIGEQLLRDFAAKCADIANLDKQPKLEGRNMSMFLSPKPQNTNSKK